MKYFNVKFYFLLLAVFLSFADADSVSDSSVVDAPNVYIDCEECDMDFIKSEIPFVDYVIDRAVADIHILITTEETASGGTKYTIRFFGLRDYAGMDDTLSFAVAKFDSEDTIRRMLAKKIKLGLIRYIARTPIADDIEISIQEKTVQTETADRWHNWVFDIGLRTFLMGQQYSDYISTRVSFSADRITEEWKTETSVYYDYIENSFEMDESTTVTSIKKSYGSWGRVVQSIDDHWSGAGGVLFSSSTYNNERFVFKVTPAIEYNIFPYSQSASRELRIYYKIGYAYYLYEEETIYDKMERKLWFEALSAELDTKQRWGSVGFSITGSHYFYDYKKNRITLFSSLSLSVIKGLSFNLFGYAAWIHDQLSLPKRDLTPEEILLEMKQQATQYEYHFSIGFSYSFGSLYSNIVNPRFGD